MAIVDTQHLSAHLQKELTVYSTEVTDELKKIAKKYAKELVKKTKATAPSGNRKYNKYRDSITSKKLNESERGITYVWYVNSKDANYRLTHLLVNGHATKDGGRTKANNFLQVAVDDMEKNYLKAVEEVIKNGR